MPTIQHLPEAYKRFYAVVSFSLLTAFSASFAQQNDFEKFVAERNQKFAKFESEARQRYEDFRNKANADFADFMQRKWAAVKTQPAIPAPSIPEPPVPVIKDPDDNAPIQTESLPIANINPLEPLLPQPEPPIPIIEPSLRQSPTVSFQFYNTPCKVRLAGSQRFSLPNVNEETVANVWRSMGSDQMDETLLDCLVLRNNLLLGDWGYIALVRILSESFFGKPCSEAVLLQMYLLTHSGYKVRLARVENQLVLLAAFSETFYEYSFIAQGSDRFYILDTHAPHSGYYMFDYAFPNEMMPSLQQENLPVLMYQPTKSRTFTSFKYPAVKISLSPNRNLIDFFNDYPLISQWQYYVSASLSDEIKEVLYPMLQTQLAGKTQKESVSILLDFVQTAFEYKTDDEQFGYERPLFGDETFFYPYSDCEDRAILFSILVRELVGLDVVLLLYPEHLATAVKFTEAMPTGSYFPLEDGSYVICDPTYIHAGVGECMPQFRGMGATIIRI